MRPMLGQGRPAGATLEAIARRVCVAGSGPAAIVMAVLAPVLCQPSPPLDDPAAREISAGELAAVRERLDRDDLTALGDRFVPRVPRLRT